jgi:nitronate monooxygenase
MIKTRLTDQFDLDYPVVCAPMALVTGGKLAGAVSQAGGLGILGGGYAGMLGGEPDLDDEYRAAGNQPIGIGFITWAAEQNPSVIDWAVALKPRCLFLSFGDPAPFARKARDAGIPVFCQVQTLEHARAALDAGASVIVAQGSEAGGHGARRSSMPFVPEVADLLARQASDVLLLAAGGIADGRGLAASLMLGADGVLVGSRFWASKEALTPQSAIDRAIASDGDGTVRTIVADQLRGVAWPEDYSFRMLKNRMTDDWANRETEARNNFGAMKDTYDEARRTGDLDIVATVVGEAAGLIHDRPAASEIMESMANEAEALLAKGNKLVIAG